MIFKHKNANPKVALKPQFFFKNAQKNMQYSPCKSSCLISSKKYFTTKRYDIFPLIKIPYPPKGSGGRKLLFCIRSVPQAPHFYFFEDKYFLEDLRPEILYELYYIFSHTCLKNNWGSICLLKVAFLGLKMTFYQKVELKNYFLNIQEYSLQVKKQPYYFDPKSQAFHQTYPTNL